MSYINDGLGAAHISDTYQYAYEAARNAFFTLFIDGLDDLKSPINGAEDKNILEGTLDGADGPVTVPTNETSIQLNVVKCPIPHFSVETGEYRRGNEVIKFATIPTWEGGSIIVDDVIGLNTKDILLAWLYQAYDPRTGKGGRMAKYKKVATLCEYTQDYELIRKWSIKGIFVTGLTEGEFDKENDGKRQVTVNFVFDRAVLEPLA